MFKHLIKKVREESSNSSILPENSPDDTNGHSTRDTNDSVDPENVTLARTHVDLSRCPMHPVTFSLKRSVRFPHASIIHFRTGKAIVSTLDSIQHSSL